MSIEETRHSRLIIFRSFKMGGSIEGDVKSSGRVENETGKDSPQPECNVIEFRIPFSLLKST